MQISVVTPTHNPQYLREVWQSLVRQRFTDFEWVILANGGVAPRDVCDAIGTFDSRIRIEWLPNASSSIGELKATAFCFAKGEILVELDHDDELASTALETIADAFSNHPEVGFVYSDAADFSPTNQPVTYHDPDRAAAWKANGWTFRETVVDERTVLAPNSWRPSAQALSLIYWAPNHVRAWRKNVYDALGGHNPRYTVCDDHELLIRTYLSTTMLHIPEVLYLYRVTGDNSWLNRQPLIAKMTHQLRDEYLYRLVEREASLRGLPKFDLGGAFDCPAGWTSIDRDVEYADIYCDLEGTWSFEDNSVGAFRAFDTLEHLRHPVHTMREIYRCLAPGGWLLSMTPSTDGRGAFQDPSHVSFWNENSFWYWTRSAQAKYLRNIGVTAPLFVEARCFTTHPSPWHEQNRIPYVVADLWALKGDCSHLPYERAISSATSTSIG